ncbi:MAG: hypothetical protein AAGH82_06505 [Pseudomonadota bacterium]
MDIFRQRTQVIIHGGMGASRLARTLVPKQDSNFSSRLFASQVWIISVEIDIPTKTRPIISYMCNQNALLLNVLFSSISLFLNKVQENEKEKPTQANSDPK